MSDISCRNTDALWNISLMYDDFTFCLVYCSPKSHLKATGLQSIGHTAPARVYGSKMPKGQHIQLVIRRLLVSSEFKHGLNHIFFLEARNFTAVA